MSLLKRIERGSADGEPRAYQHRLLSQLLKAIQKDDALRPQVETLLQQQIAQADEQHREQVRAKIENQSLNYSSESVL